MKLIHGDCLEVMQDFEDNSIDLILTDPPYFKVKGEAWDRQWDTADGFLAWLDTVLVQFERIMKPNGSLYLFASPKMAARVEVLIGGRFNVLSNITWAKPPFSTKAEMFDKDTCRNYFPVTERIIFAEHYGADNYAKGDAGYQRKCDELRGFIFEPIRDYLATEWERSRLSRAEVNAAIGSSKNGGGGMASHYFSRITTQWELPTKEHYETLQRYFNEHANHSGEYLRREYEELRREYEELRRPFTVSADVPFTDVWTFKTVSTYKGKHPCEKPAPMLEHIIKASSKPGAVVLDAFMGTGSTGLACQKLGREFIGIEKNDKYFKQAEQRIQEAQPPLFT